MSKQFWIILVVIVAVFVGIVGFTGKGNKTSSNPTDHTIGSGSTGVTLVEYGDYQCPYCGQYYPTVKAVVDKYKSQITYQFRNFPLTSIHQNAFAAARAAEAAGLMGKYWEMHDLLYQENLAYYNSNEKTPTWIGVSNPESVFVNYASSLGLDTTKFKQLYASEQVNNLIIADENAGNKLGVNATPTFYIDGKQVQISNSQADFETAINNAIAKKQGKATRESNTGSTQQSQGSVKK